MYGAYAIAILTGYLLGSFYIAYIIGKKVGKMDIRAEGSQNSGASNVTRVLGWKYGIITAVVDILKGVLPVVLMRMIFPGNMLLAYVAGAFAVLGHIYPITLGFRGGKGTASFIGFMTAFDWRIGLAMAATIVAVTLVTDYIAIGTIAMGIVMLGMTWYLGYGTFCVAAAAFFLVLMVVKHMVNIQRIIKKEEVGLRAVAKKKNN